MLLGSLRVLHVHKRSSAEGGDSAAVIAFGDTLFPGAFSLDTCQRRLWVFPSFGAASRGAPSAFPGAEPISGAAAYAFLLRVATGLESQVAGETDIFGQLKEAWFRFEEQGSPLLPALGPWIQKLFEDTKEIRAQHLQNVGAASYGSLVRKLLRGFSASPQEPILLLGAGQIAQSIAPWLADHELWILNRTPAAAEALAREVLAREPKARVRVIQGAEQKREAYLRAAHLVLCIPPSAEADGRRIALWMEGNARSAAARAVIHLGGMRRACGEWAEVPGFHCLDELFDLQKQQNEARAVQLDRARRACNERASLRALPGSVGGSATLPHGWEDLAIFAV